MSEQNKKLRFSFQGEDKLSPALGSIGASASSAITGLKGLNTSLSDIKKNLSRVDAFKSASEQYKALAVGAESAKEKVKTLTEAMKSSEKVTSEQKNELRLARAELKNYESGVLQAGLKVSKLSESLEKAKINTRDLTHEEAKLRAEKDRLSKSIDQETEQLAKKKARTESRDLFLARSSRLAIIGGAVNSAAMTAGNLLLGPIRDAAAFEKAMSNVEAKGYSDIKDRDERKRQVAPLRKQAMELGASTSYSSLEVAGLQAELAGAGYKQKDILSSTGTVLKIGQAGGLGLAEAADLTTGLVSMYNLSSSQKDTEMIGDTLAKTASDTKTDMSEMAEVFKYTGTASNLLGISIQGTAALISGLAAANIKGSDAGTALRATLSRLAAPTKNGREELQKLGVRLKDAHGNFRDVNEIIADYAKATEKLSNTEQLRIAKEVAGEEAATGFLALTKEAGKYREIEIDGVKRLVSGLEALKLGYKEAGGYLERASFIMSDNAAKSFDNLKGSIEGLSTVIGTSFLGNAEGLSKGIESITNSITKFNVEHPELSKNLMLGVTGLAALSAAGWGAKLMWGGLSLSMTGIVPILSVLKGAVFGLAGALAALNPWVALFGGVAAVGAGLALRDDGGGPTELAQGMNFPSLSNMKTIPQLNMDELIAKRYPTPGEQQGVSGAFTLNSPITLNIAPGASPEEIARQIKLAQEQLLEEQKRKSYARKFD